MAIKNSELILNSDGSIYHLHLKPSDIADTLIFVGDQERVGEVTKYFDRIDFEMQSREFKTQTGYYKGKRLSVISTGIGPDNIDIVLNELDALVNIDFNTREIKATKTSLSIVRIGTSGALQPDIDVDSFVISSYGMDINGMLQSYKIDAIKHADIEAAFVKHTQWSPQKPYPVIIENSKQLEAKLKSDQTLNGLTATCGGFYGPQGRVLRLELQDDSLNHKMDSFDYKGLRVTNFEMETSAIYGLSKLLGHKACSMNAILANRALGTFSKTPLATIDKLIVYTLNKLVS
ncbi:MAG: nucleoside phosphorylase [Flavobacteriaceae bacterium]|jgi:uridine phosphorylase|nr:nucleoside phosphorylase [Flavobacteriaceae bacterium]MDG1794676.1 nucleoside phosphorylase [Flavobacteriaceae bacterium]